MAAAPSLRLLRAEIIDEDHVSFDVDLAPRPGSTSWTTLVTGRNGAGKSRLLSAIAGAFEALDSEKAPKPSTVSVQYMLDGHDCAVRVERGKVTAFLDGRLVEPEKLPRPHAVVAATSSAFDKFSLPRDRGPFNEKPATPSLYKYLGIKDSRGRVSAKAAVNRSLEQLFDASGNDLYRRGRVADVFRYLGYLPSIEVVYSWSARGRSLTGLTSPRVTANDISRLLEREMRSVTGSRSQVPGYLLGNEPFMRELAWSAERLRQLTHGRDIRLVANFSAPASTPEDQLRMARQLSRAGLAQMTQVVLTRASSGQRLVLSEASSGELSLAVTLLGIASSIEDSSLVLIDEPEISLHPQWQVEYLGRLTQAFEAYRGCHFLVATHSPTLVSGSDPERTNIVDLEGTQSAQGKAPPSGSVDEVLVREFGVATDGNLYLRQLLVESLRLVADRQTQSERFVGVLTTLRKAVQRLPAPSPVRELVEDLGRVRDAEGGKPG